MKTNHLLDFEFEKAISVTITKEGAVIFGVKVNRHKTTYFIKHGKEEIFEDAERAVKRYADLCGDSHQVEETGKEAD
jgi:hypothetical protein